ncbi:MAG: D-amino peptidase [Actinomycetota bacterium]|jgi:D-amino peptidase|nr:D-amino peptidase [Actinomycetota bacterium]
MRVFIISDMEGVAGITRWEQVSANEKGYEEGRRLYTEEINAAVRGAHDGGATEVVVMDCHGAGNGWSFNSLIPDLLDDRCEWVVQHDWTEYTGFLEEGCDAALFVAMHAMAGTADGVLSHTVSGTQWRNLRFNGKLVGETGINAALCGMWDCPVLLVSGDRATCNEATELLGGGITTVCIKKGIGRFSARHIPPRRARAMIEAGAKEALADLGAVEPYRLESPCEIEVELASSDLTDEYQNRNGIELKDPRTIISRADDWWTAWKQIYL